MAFIIKPYEHAAFQKWYKGLDPKYRALWEVKGMPTEETIEKVWVSGYRAAGTDYEHGYESGQSDGPRRIG